MMGSSSSWSAQTFGSSSSCVGAGFGQTVGSVSSTPWATFPWPSPTFMVSHTPPSGSPCCNFMGVSEQGSRVCAYAPTAVDGPSNFYQIQSISAMLVNCNKSHEELRHEDYERGDRGGDSLQKSINPTPIFPVFSSPSFGLSCSSTPAFHFEAHDSSHCSISGTVSPSFARARPFPESTEHPPAELLPSTRGSTFSSHPFCAVREKKSSNPFWLPSAQSSFSSGDLQSLTQGHSSYTPGLPFYHYLPSKLASMGITPPLSHTEFLKNPSTYCPSSYQSPFTAQVGGAHSASASTQSMTTATLPCPHFATSTSVPTMCRDNIFSNSAGALNTDLAEATSTQGTFGQNFPTTYTQPGKTPLIGSSIAHSKPALSSDAHCTSVNLDYPNNTLELHLPVNVRLLRIHFSSSNDGAGISQVHSGHVAKSTEAPISLSIYPGENHELIIQSVARPAKDQMGKQSSSTGGSDPSKVHNSIGRPPSKSAGNQEGSNGDAHSIQKSLAAPERQVITRSVLPRLYNADYYTVPSIVELAVNESEEPGYCSRVPHFTVGRHGYGSVRFDGETDVRKLDIASIVEFNNREILVYRDESNTPPVGQGLNKPAEVTLLNVKCIDQKTGLQFTGGPTVDRYKETLVQWTKEHDAEFVSFDPMKGEWKFKVKNFSQ
ncbi:hypothetical protein PVAP13_5NG354500 [Panicum virgatum]|uniref:Peptidase S59 domain-containing protein n=1 Tax=Panicum virgatum TaxID=38727 RepID=A0A8T0RW13_PANVG|nr:hypothetical protein PVAP13_5NG354500 [Panicum virgatum]KAG2588881.1 hypothetical protein PVAP13_5NG354500 [Panicum virgatum]